MRIVRALLASAVASYLAIGLSCADDAPAGSGGSAGAGGAPSTGPTSEQIEASRTVATKDCARWEKCAPLVFASHFADQASCVEKNAVFWAAHFFGKDSGATLESARQCGEDLDLDSCDAWWWLNYGAGPGACDRTGSPLCESIRMPTSGDGPASCFPKGSRPAYSADAEVSRCGAGGQCASGICWFGQDPGDPCGICHAVANGEGDACPQDYVSCPGGLHCGSEGRCIPLGGSYEPCGGCLPQYVCFAGQCRPRLEDGEACAPNANFGTGNCEVGHVCNPVTSVCESPIPQALGAQCGLLAEGRTGSCERGAACQLSKTGAGATCVPRVPLGQACGTGFLFGSGCEYPGDCVAGVCRLRGPATCE